MRNKRVYKWIGMLAVGLMAVLPCAADLFEFEVDPFYAESVMKGKFGDSPVYFFLGPSPSMEKAIIAFIDSAAKTLDVCLYDLNLPPVAQALLDAKDRGVKVRVIIADENAEKAYAISGMLKQMEKKKMLMLAHNRSGLMHNKFMVADKERIWTGSCNFTRTGTRFNDNHVIILESKELAENYTKEWEEIADKRHGKRFAWPTPHPRVTVGDTEIQNYFSPEDDVRGALIAEMNKATNEIVIMAFSFTDPEITEAVRRAVDRDVRVVIVLDSGMATHPSSKTKELIAIGANVRMSPGVLLHHKVMVMDRKTVVLGSANFSKAAFARNDENVLIVNAPSFAKAMLREAMRCWRAEPYSITKWRTRLPSGK